MVKKNGKTKEESEEDISEESHGEEGTQVLAGGPSDKEELENLLASMKKWDVRSIGDVEVKISRL